jgi:hypothetical protein
MWTVFKIIIIKSYLTVKMSNKLKMPIHNKTVACFSKLTLPPFLLLKLSADNRPLKSFWTHSILSMIQHTSVLLHDPASPRFMESFLLILPRRMSFRWQPTGVVWSLLSIVSSCKTSLQLMQIQKYVCNAYTHMPFITRQFSFPVALQPKSGTDHPVLRFLDQTWLDKHAPFWDF